VHKIRADNSCGKLSHPDFQNYLLQVSTLDEPLLATGLIALLSCLLTEYVGEHVVLRGNCTCGSFKIFYQRNDVCIGMQSDKDFLPMEFYDCMFSRVYVF
jgi:hypothetical protein